MSRLTIAAIAAVICIASGAVPVDAQGRRDLVKAKIRQPFSELPISAGLRPVIVEIQNDAPTGRDVRISIESYGDDATTIRRRVHVASGEDATVELPVPVTSNDWSQVEVETDEEDRIERTQLDTRGGLGPWNELGILVISEENQSSFALKAYGSSLSRPTRHTGGRGYYFHGGGSGSIGVLRLQKEEDLPRRWASWTGIDILLLHAPTVLGFSAEMQRTMLRYVETGGTAVLYGLADAVGAAERLFPALVERSLASGPYGLGYVALVETDPFDDSAGGDHAAWEAIFGANGLVPAARISAYDRLGIITPAWRWSSGPFGPSTSDAAPDIPGLAKLPVRMFALLVVLFAILIGPVNFIWLKRKKLPQLALITIPVIATLAMVLLISYSIAAEGLDVKVVSRTVTWLDQRDHRAASLSKPGFYAGLAPKGGLKFKGDVAPLSNGTEITGGRRMKPMPVDWSGGLTLPSGWVPGRIPVEFLLMQTGTCRQRLQISAEADGVVTVTNALEADVRRLIIRTPGERFLEVRNLAAGETATALEFKGAKVADFLAGGIQKDVRDSWRESPAPLDSAVPASGYVAVVSRSIFAEVGTDDVTELPGMHIVRGHYVPGAP